MKTTSLADARTQPSSVVRTHERVTITKDGRPAAVLISAEDLDALDETLFWAGQARGEEGGETVEVDVIAADLAQRQARAEG